jgi:hydroxymethylpyrimidine pyrophosphatase-like HAD family hydrolase
MKYNLPPFNEKVPRGFFEQSILDFSSELFKNPYLGYALAFLINILYIYTYCKSKSCISILIYLFMAYLLTSIILAQLAHFKKSDKKEIKDESISEEKFNTLLDWINNNGIKCDIASISSSIAKINDSYYYSSISSITIMDIINKFNDSIYTTFGEAKDFSFVTHYKDRLKFFYPKNFIIKDIIDSDILTINIAISNDKSDDLKKYLNESNLYFESIGKDKNREILRIKKEIFNKVKIGNILKNIYKDYKVIAITDSIADLDMFKISDITIAMKNGDNEIKKMAQYITEFDQEHNGAIKMLDYICHLK